MRKNVYAIVTNDLNYDQRMHRICSALVEAGYTVNLVGRERRSSIPTSEKSFKQTRLKCIFDSGPLFYMEINLRLFFFLLRKDVQFLHVVDFDTMPAAILLKIFRKFKMIYDAHEYYIETPELLNSPIKKYIWNLTGKLGISLANTNITVNEALADELKKKYSSHFFVVQNVPLRNSHILPKIPAKLQSKILLYQGALNEGRGLKLYIDSIALLPEWKLIIVGDGPLKDELYLYMRKKGQGSRVVFKGYIKPAELRRITVNATIGLNLLDSRSLNYRFSLANKFFDYIQAELPSVNMNFPAYCNITEDFGVGELVNECSAETLAQLVLNMSQENNYRGYVNECKKASKVYTWENEKEKLISTYSQA